MIPQNRVVKKDDNHKTLFFRVFSLINVHFFVDKLLLNSKNYVILVLTIGGVTGKLRPFLRTS